MTTGPVRHQRVLDSCVEPECLDRIHQLLAELWIAEGGIAEIDRMLFETAVIEVAGNVVRHRRSPNGFRCWVTLGVYDTALEAVFRDTADALDPAAVEPVLERAAEVWPDETAEHGRGLALARSMVDELSYQRFDGVNQWRVCRVRTG